MLEGLEVSIVSLSALRADNPKQRMDSQYFGHAALAATASIESKPFVRFGSIVQVFRKGIFDIKADSYTQYGDGVPFVRISDLRDGLINSDTTEWISADAHILENKTGLKFSDIILSKTAYPAAAFVNVSECNVSQDTIAVKLSKDALSEYKSGYIVAFLNSRIGLTLMQREFQGNVQLHLSLDDGKKLPIPKLSFDFQTRIDDLVRSFDASNDERKQQLTEAEAALLAALGLAGWSPPEPLSYTARAADTVTAARLDAQFYAPRIRALLDLLGRDGRSVSDIARPRRDRFSAKKCDTFHYIEIGDVEGGGGVGATLLDSADAPSRATWHVRTGDVLTSTVRPIRRLSAIVAPDQDRYVASSGFAVLQPTAVSPEVLMTFLRLPVICELMDLFASASMYPAISEADILGLPVPMIRTDVGDAVTAAVQLAFTARARSRTLLAAAKRAVEIAIEDSEEAALAYLATAKGEANG